MRGSFSEFIFRVALRRVRLCCASKLVIVAVHDIEHDVMVPRHFESYSRVVAWSTPFQHNPGMSAAHARHVFPQVESKMNAGLISPSDGTNYWDLLVFSAVTGALGVSTVGGITALATDIECHVQRFDTVAVCCSKNAPVPLVPIVAFASAVLMIATVWFRRTCGARAFQSFRAHAHQASIAYGDSSKDGEVKLKEIQKSREVLALTAGKVKSNRAGLCFWAWLQLLVAVGLIITLFVGLNLAIGDGIMLGGGGDYRNQHGRNYYDFHCPASCSVLSPPPSPAPTLSPTPPTVVPTAAPTETPTQLPTQTPTRLPTSPTAAPTAQPTAAGVTTATATDSPTERPSALETTTPPTAISTAPLFMDDAFIRCRRKPESPGLFWTLAVALLLNLMGSVTLVTFLVRLFPIRCLEKSKRSVMRKGYSTCPSCFCCSKNTESEFSYCPEIRCGRYCCAKYDSGSAAFNSTSAFTCCWSCQCSCCCCCEYTPGDDDSWETECILEYSVGDGRNLPFVKFTKHLAASIASKCNQAAADTARVSLNAQKTILKILTRNLITVMWLHVLGVPTKFDFAKHIIEFMSLLSMLENAHNLYDKTVEELDGAFPEKKGSSRIHDGDRIQALTSADELLVAVEPLSTKDGSFVSRCEWLGISLEQLRTAAGEANPTTPVSPEQDRLLRRLQKIGGVKLLWDKKAPDWFKQNGAPARTVI